MSGVSFPYQTLCFDCLKQSVKLVEDVLGLSLILFASYK